MAKKKGPTLLELSDIQLSISERIEACEEITEDEMELKGLVDDELKAKLLDYGAVIKDYRIRSKAKKAQGASLKESADSFTNAGKALDNRIKSMLEVMGMAILSGELMEEFKGDKPKNLKNNLATVYLAKAPDKIEVVEDMEVRARLSVFGFCKPKYDPDKEALKVGLKALGEGESIEGVTVVPGAKSVRVK